ncbi:hypothetical protein ANRL2_04641 [Anaerolineae bacterium]|nr:hypothetical protein ANRL2_04641 [Anaerolineae bacterium]
MPADPVLTAALIFFLRVVNSGIGTVRLIMLARQRRALTVVLGFFEALTFAITVAGVVTDLSNVPNMLAYCFGFAAGAYLGMTIEARFITSYMIVNVVSASYGHDIALALRNGGYGVTETVGEGLNGKVTMLRSIVNRRDVPGVVSIVTKHHPEAFVSVEEARTVQHGWLRRSVRNQPTL